MRSAYDTVAVRGAGAIALLFEGKHAGNIVTGRNASSGAVTATVSIWGGPLKMEEGTSGHAGGGGYCRWSGAVADAAQRLPKGHPAREVIGKLGGAGQSTVRSAMEKAGYQFIEVLSDG